MKTLRISNADYQLMLDVARRVYPSLAAMRGLGLRELNLMRRYTLMVRRWERNKSKEE